MKEIELATATKSTLGKKPKQQVTIKIDADTITYFKKLSQRSGIPYQSLINLYLTDCATNKKELYMVWK